MSIRDEMPLLARHEGEWRGTYRYVDASGAEVDRHQSVLHCTFPAEGPHAYFQTNDYSWDDGRTEHIEFPATYLDRRIVFATERIDGHAWEVDANAIVLTWRYLVAPTVPLFDPAASLYELILLDASGTRRTRTWHWLDRSGSCFMRTLIDEKRAG